MNNLKPLEVNDIVQLDPEKVGNPMFAACDKVPEYQKENTRILLNMLTDGINDIFYKDKKDE